MTQVFILQLQKGGTYIILYQCVQTLFQSLAEYLC